MERSAWFAHARPRLEKLEDRLVLNADNVAIALAANTAPSFDVARDAVLHWNDVMLDANAIDCARPITVQDQIGPTRVSRAFAIVSAAVFDAVNSITHANAPYLVELGGFESANKTAAISAAAHATLKALWPDQAARFDDALAKALAVVPNGPAETRGVELGRRVAQVILADRLNDGSNAPMPYTPIDEPGHHRPDPENPDQGFLTPGWGDVDTFVIGDVERFQVDPVPALGSLEYTLAYYQVALLGGDGITTPTLRTPEQTQIGKFWAYDKAPAVGTPPRLYNQVVQTIAVDQGNSTEENARLFALVNLAMADAGIQCWDAKYDNDFWRPIVGIREGNADTNPITIGVPNWTPLGAPLSNGTGKNFTPPFPAYGSGHATFGAATLRVVGNFYGTSQIEFDFQSDEFNGHNFDVNATTPRPAVTRHYDNLDEAIDENAISRIYLGIHWIFDATNGVNSGKAIADYVTTNALLPRQVGGTTLQFSAGTRPLDVLVVIDGERARIVDRQTGQVLASRSSDQLSRVVITGSTGNDRIEVTLAADAPVLAGGIFLTGLAGSGDEVLVNGSGAADTFLLERNTVTINGSAIHLSGVEKLRLGLGREDTLLVLEQPQASFTPPGFSGSGDLEDTLDDLVRDFLRLFRS